MNSKKCFAPIALCLAGLGLLRAAAAAEPVPALDLDTPLPPVAAEYRSTLRDAGAEPKVSTWRFWREEDCVERENPARGSGELWQRDGKTIFLTRIYHADRKGIEYRNDDLEILGATPQWKQLSLLLDPDLLGQLAEVEAGWEGGMPVRRYVGEVSGTHWDITLRTDLVVPARVLRTRGDHVEELELLQASLRAQATWQPTPIVGYEIIDHADLGDRERDPFVMRIAAEEGYEHGYEKGHGHAH